MKFPRLNVIETSRQMVDVFGGYNHNLRIGDGEFYHMENMTSDHYPVASPRGKRGIYLTPADPQGMIAKDVLCYVDGENFVIGDKAIAMGLSTQPEDCPKTLVSMGAYVAIFPDKKYINTMDPENDNGSMEASWEAKGTVNFSLCNQDGAAYECTYGSEIPPVEGVEDGALWLDLSGNAPMLKQYSASTKQWVSIATTYVKISATGIGKNFSKYDGVIISGIQGVMSSVLRADSLNGSAVIWDKGDDYILVTGMFILNTTQELEEGVITVKRAVPDMDFVIEASNRLWGCKYGTVDGKPVNEIYCSKLGDFKNWQCKMGISTDSSTISVGSDGPFTGAITHLDYPVFFKEDVLHKIYISSSGAHSATVTPCRGVQRGCERSLAIVNEVLYYKARSGVCAYDGSLPVEISQALGTVRYKNAVAGAHGSKYYISMQEADGADHHLFVYDTAKGVWHREDGLQAEAFCACQDALYCLSGGKILDLLGSGEQLETEIAWAVQTGQIGISSPDMKYLSRLTVRLSLDEDAETAIYVKYDFEEEWEHLCSVTGCSLRSFDIPIRPKRCDHMQLRIEGTGAAKIYSFTKTIEQGSAIS